MSSSQGLVKEIIAKPFDNQPRLIYADWVEECGDPARAEFIRLQCEQETYERWQVDFEKLKQQSLKLLTKHEPVWKKQMGISSRAYFRRGFIQQLTVTPKALLQLDPSVFSSTPIFSIQLSRVKNDKLTEICKSGILKSVLGLNVQTSLATEAVIEVLNNTSNRFQRLDLSGAAIEFDKHLAKAIGESKFAKRLSEFYIRACSVPESFFKALGDCGGLPKVERFEFGGGFEIAHPAHFESLKMSRLRHLVAGGKFRVVDCEQLCYLPLKKLTSISLRGARPPAAGLKMLIEAGAFKNAERINLGTCNLSKASLKQLIDCKTPKCTHLNLACNDNVDQEIFGQIVDGRTFPRLKAINVEATKVKVTGQFSKASPIAIVY